MNSLHDLLLKRDFDMPPEVAAIKQYVHSEFNADVSVQLREKRHYYKRPQQRPDWQLAPAFAAAPKGGQNR